MRSGRVVLDPVQDEPSLSAAAGPSRRDEEARLQAAIAMTQLSSASTSLGQGDQGQWRHMAFGGMHREKDQTEKEDQEKQRRKAVVMKGVSNGAADPETGEVRSAPEVNDSTTAGPCPAQSRTDQKVTGDPCVGKNREGGESLLISCDYMEGRDHVLGNRSQSGGNRSDCGFGGEEMTGTVDKSSFSEEHCPKGKFVRTAQPSGSGEVVWMKKTSDKLTGKCEDILPTVTCEDTLAWPSPAQSRTGPIVKRKTTRNSDEARPSKIPRQRKPSKNAPSPQATQSKGGSSKKVLDKRTGNGTLPTVTRESERSVANNTLPDHAVRGMVFAINPQGGVLIPLAPLATIPTTIAEAERHLLAWLPSNVVSVSRGLSLAASESASSVSLPSCSAQQLDALMPRVTYAPPSIIPASVCSSEDVDTLLSSDAAASVAKSSTSKRSRKREKHRRIPDGKNEDVRFTTHSSRETFQSPAFQVEEKMKADGARLSEVHNADKSIKGVVPIIEFNLSNRFAQSSELESNQGVDLSTRKYGNTTGETPKKGDAPAFQIKTESKSFTDPDTNSGSCTSPLDLTTHWGSYGSLGSLKSFYTLSGPTIETEKHDNPHGDLRDSKDIDIVNRIPNPGPTDYDPNRVRHDDPRTRGLVESGRHGSALNNIKGITRRPGRRPTSSMIYEKKSPSAESTVDKYDLTQNTICSALIDSVSGWQETTMNLADPELQMSRWEQRTCSRLPGSVREFLRSETRDGAPPVTMSPSAVGGHSFEAVENTGHSRPASQCSSDLQAESSRIQENCRLPPKKRKMPVDFNQEVQPNPDALDLANGHDLSKRSSREEIPQDIKHPEQTTWNYHHQHLPPLVGPLPANYGSGGGGEMVQRLQEQNVRDSMPVSALEIIVKLEIRDRKEMNDGVIRNAATSRQEFGSGGMSIDGKFALSSFSSSLSSSSPSPRRTTTNFAIHSAIQPDEDGDLPLHVAVAQGLESVVDSLVSVMSQLNTNIDVFNNNRQTPLHVAVITNQREIVRKLLEAGACPNLSDRKGHNSVHLAVNNRCHECLRILLSDSKYPVDVDAMNYEGLMPLHLAVQLGDVHSVEALLSFGAQVNGVDGKNGRTALYYAAEKSDLASAELLLQTGASPSIASYSGCLPVNAARSNGAMVKLLDRYSAGGVAVMGLERSAAAVGGCGVAMATTKTGNRDAKRREGKQVKSKD